jgi:speckle-type POZ protein
MSSVVKLFENNVVEVEFTITSAYSPQNKPIESDRFPIDDEQFSLSFPNLPNPKGDHNLLACQLNYWGQNNEIEIGGRAIWLYKPVVNYSSVWKRHKLTTLNTSILISEWCTSDTNSFVEYNTAASKNKVLIRLEFQILNSKRNETCMPEQLILALANNPDLYSDITILTNSNVRFSAHKLILGVRSPVFQAMLSSNLLEATSNEILIIDFSPDVIRLFIQFIYTDMCSTPDLQDNVTELYKMADKYQVNSLKNMCEKRMISSLTVSNVVEILLFADYHSVDFVKMSAIHFIVSHSKEIINAPESDYFERITGDLANQIVKALADK